MEQTAIKDPFIRVTKKQKLSTSKSHEMVDQIIQEIGNAIDLIRPSNPDSCKTVLGELKKKLQEIAPLSQLEGTQKELNIAFSKYLKVPEKSFNPDISKAYMNVEFDIHTTNKIIASHFYRQGLLNVGDCFMNETKESKTDLDVKRSHFLEMYEILVAMENRDLEPALNWVMENSDKLGEMISSKLMLKLYCVQFVDILQSGNKIKALSYARKKLTPFASDHMSEIKKYMNCICWSGKLDRSPYTHLLSSTANWISAAEELTKQFCNFLGQPYKCPLSVTIAAGLQVLTPLLKFMNVITSKQHEWQTMKQTPVPMELDEEFQFHSNFVCPVSKEQASDENPPMLLTCGHVLCKLTLNKISKNGTRTFKCPYCPSEIAATECWQLFL